MASIDRSPDIEVLNDLISATFDSAEDYEKAAADVTDPQLKQFFTRRGLERRRLVHGLQDLVRRLGGRAEDEGSLLAKAQRAFVDLKTGIAGNNDNTAIVDEVERGEDLLEGCYARVLEREDVSSEARQTVATAFIAVKSGHAQVAALKLAAE